MTQDQIMQLVDEYAQKYLDGYVEAQADFHTPVRAVVVTALEQLAKDAERYQWLRLYGYVDSMKKFPRTDPVQTDMFDLAIDAAMKEQI